MRVNKAVYIGWFVTAAVMVSAVSCRVACAQASGAVIINDVSDAIPGSTIEVPVFLSNTVGVRAISIPLIIRSQTGGTIGTLRISYRDRLAAAPDSPLSDYVFSNIFFSEDGSCKGNASGGFGTVTYNDTLTHPISHLPVGVLIARGRFLPDGGLAAGDDAFGSIRLNVTLGEGEGCFVIDSTCADPDNHLLLSDDLNHAVPISFRPGQVCIVEPPPCQCTFHMDFDADGFITALDVAALIDVLFAGRLDPWDHYCPVSRGDADCDGFATVLDLAAVVDYVFAGGTGVCDPCLSE